MPEATSFNFDEVNKTVIADFRANDGTAPTAVDGMFAKIPLILVHHVGAKSGAERIAPLAYYTEDDRLFVFGSKGGADENPAWYHNLVANPVVTIEVQGERFEATARVVDDADEYERLYAEHARKMPGFAEYRRMTSRRIPVIVLERVESEQVA
jgi:deazaflavin-dependent oxidoreductase (nitroreductase family)